MTSSFLDFGPVFEEWEADFGRTYVVGDDPLKHRLRRDIEEAFASGKQYFHEHPEITAAELYAHAQQLAGRAGWEYRSSSLWARSCAEEARSQPLDRWKKR